MYDERQSDTPSFGALLRHHRSAAGLTQEELAERAGLSRRGIADLERGARQTPYVATIERLAEALGLSKPERDALLAAGRARKLDTVDLEPPAADADKLAANGPLYRRVFVGREAELRELRAACDRTANEGGQLLLVVGEPGVGKTSICLELARYAASLGMATHFGHMYEEGFSSVPYLPFVQVLREYVLERSVENLRGEVANLASDVARILPEVCDVLGVAPRPTRDPEEDRWRLLTAVTDFLRAAARQRPLMLILEDLQWADRGTLDLLVFLSRRLAGTRLLVVCTYRDVEVDRAHPLAAALVELRRGANVTRIPVRGLGVSDVLQMVSSLVGEEVDLAIAEAVQQQTEGNPLFVQEIARYLVEEGLFKIKIQTHPSNSGPGELLSSPVPEGVRDVIGRRLSKLSAECNQALSAAAVIGREFGLQTLQQVTDLDEEVLVEALEQAHRMHVLDDASVAGEVRFRFNHALFRQTLYEELFTPRRLRLHQRVARVLEAQYSSHLEEHAAELSEHFAQSSDATDLGKARQYAEMAAAKATRVSAHGEAVRYLRSALHLLDLVGEDIPQTRLDLVLALGEAMLAAGDARTVLDEVAPEAFRSAEGLGDRRRAFASSLLASRAFSSRRGFAVTDTPEFRTWAERKDRYAQAESRERVIADHAMLASLWAEGREAAAHQLSLRSLKLARRLGILRDVSTIVIEPWMTPPYRQRERLELANELRTGLEESRPAGRRCLATLHLGDAFLTWGDRDKSQALWNTLPQQADDSKVPFVRSVAYRVRLLTDCLDGQLERAVQLGEALEGQAEALGLGPFAHATAAIYLWRTQLHLGSTQRCIAGLSEALQHVAPSDIRVWGFSGVLSAQLALCLAHAGRLQESQAIVARFLQARAIGQSGDETSMPILVALLEAAMLLNDATTVGRLIEPLTVAAHLVCVDNTMTVVARHLGAAMALLGNVSEAVAYTRLAIEVAEKVRFRPELALARLQFAELLSAEPEDSLVAELESMHMQPALARARAVAR
jgi:transcriptional regulator with XRE-family HTH domain/tetratricopeptide (TPR) repeat protein